jgi:hypothetical protein
MTIYVKTLVRAALKSAATSVLLLGFILATTYAGRCPLSGKFRDVSVRSIHSSSITTCSFWSSATLGLSIHSWLRYLIPFLEFSPSMSDSLRFCHGSGDCDYVRSAFLDPFCHFRK